MSLLDIEGLGEDKGELFPLIPAARYPAEITMLEEKPTKEKAMPMLKISFRILEGEFQGRKLITNIVLPNPQQDAEQQGLSRARLKRLIVACGLTGNIQGGRQFSTDDLHGCRCLIVVTTKKKGDEPAKNEIADYLNAEAAITPTGTPVGGTTSLV